MTQKRLNLNLSHDEARSLSVAAGKVLQPRAPITTRELFAGRWDQLTTVADAVNQSGLHVAIYGERGVGKTSLSNVVRPTIRAFDTHDQRIVVKANANSGDAFDVIWLKLLSEISWVENRASIGLSPVLAKTHKSLVEVFGLSTPLGVDDVRRALSRLSGAVFIVDEFDRAASATSRQFTDLIKGLSDFAVDCTVIVVGVAGTVDQLVADHASISRALIQVHLPRMNGLELAEILHNAEKSLGIEFSDEAKSLIIHISQGLPHYTHLIGLHAVRMAALDRYTSIVERQDVFKALKEAVKQAQQSVTERHSKATRSAHKEALYRQVLLACAITAATSHDALGYFNPGSVVIPLQTVLGRPVEIATFNNHLAEFCEDKRGSVLERDGQPRAYSYRFYDPLMVPFVFMDALATDLIKDDELSQALGSVF